MKKAIIAISFVAAVILLIAATPSFRDFNSDQFTTNTTRVNAKSGIQLTNPMRWINSVTGSWIEPFWDTNSIRGRPAYYDPSNQLLFTIRHSGTQPSGAAEGSNNEVLYISRPDAISLQTASAIGYTAGERITFVFGSDATTWRWRDTNLFIDAGSTGTDTYRLLGYDYSGTVVKNFYCGSAAVTNRIQGAQVNIETNTVITGTFSAGSAGQFSVSNGGLITDTSASTHLFTGSISIGSGKNFIYASSSIIGAPANGFITLYNNATTSFGALNFGGNTAASPSIGKTNGDFIVFGGDNLFGGGDTNKLRVLGGAGTVSCTVGGTFLVDQTAYTNLNGTPGTFTNLGVITITANTLTNNGDRIICRWEIDQQLAKVNTNEFKITCGANTPLDTGLQITSNGTIYASCQLTRLSANSIRISPIEGGLDWSNTQGRPFANTNFFAKSYTLDTGTNNTVVLQGAAQAVGAFTNILTTASYFPRP